MKIRFGFSGDVEEPLSQFVEIYCILFDKEASGITHAATLAGKLADSKHLAGFQSRVLRKARTCIVVSEIEGAVHEAYVLKANGPACVLDMRTNKRHVSPSDVIEPLVRSYQNEVLYEGRILIEGAGGNNEPLLIWTHAARIYRRTAAVKDYGLCSTEIDRGSDRIHGRWSQDALA